MLEKRFGKFINSQSSYFIKFGFWTVSNSPVTNFSVRLFVAPSGGVSDITISNLLVVGMVVGDSENIFLTQKFP